MNTEEPTTVELEAEDVTLILELLNRKLKSEKDALKSIPIRAAIRRMEIAAGLR